MCSNVRRCLQDVLAPPGTHQFHSLRSQAHAPNTAKQYEIRSPWGKASLADDCIHYRRNVRLTLLLLLA